MCCHSEEALLPALVSCVLWGPTPSMVRGTGVESRLSRLHASQPGPVHGCSLRPSPLPSVLSTHRSPVPDPPPLVHSGCPRIRTQGVFPPLCPCAIRPRRRWARLALPGSRRDQWTSRRPWDGLRAPTSGVCCWPQSPRPQVLCTQVFALSLARGWAPAFVGQGEDPCLIAEWQN